MSFVLGLVANLDGSRSVHADAFRRAVALAMQRLSPKGPVFCMREDDQASAVGGVRAAERLRDARVDCVVGHFASSSAAAAGPLYAERGIPLLLPAASADGLLTRAATSYRLCQPDRVLAEHAAHDVLLLGHRRVAVEHDDSLHGLGFVRAFSAAFRAEGGQVLSEPWGADALLFSGRYLASAARVRRLRKAGFRGSVFLSDDALHPRLDDALRDDTRGVQVFGFAPAKSYVGAEALCAAYRKAYGSEPGTYFVETYAALEIASSLYDCPNPREALATRSFETVLGTVAFSGRQASVARHARFSLPLSRQIVSLLPETTLPRGIALP